MKRLLAPLRRWRKPVLCGYVAAWALAFVLTHLPGESLPKVPAGDKLLHFGGFFGLSLGFGLVLTGFGLSGGRRGRAVALSLLLYGALDEATQPFFGRTAELRDYAADLAGVAAGVALWELAARAGDREKRPLGG